HGGNIDKFQGDGLLVVFGAPEPLDDSAQRAVEAAKDMVRDIEKINQERAAVGDAPIQVGIGIDTGYVVAGNVGSERRLEYTLIGVPVNNAAFLSKLRPPAILISQGRYQAWYGQFEVVNRDPCLLQRGHRQLPVFAVDVPL